TIPHSFRDATVPSQRSDQIEMLIRLYRRRGETSRFSGRMSPRCISWLAIRQGINVFSGVGPLYRPLAGDAALPLLVGVVLIRIREKNDRARWTDRHCLWQRDDKTAFFIHGRNEFK